MARDGPRLDHKAAKDRPVRAKTTKSNCAFGVIARSLTSLTSEEDETDEVDEDSGLSDASVFSPIIEHNISLHEVVKNNNKRWVFLLFICIVHLHRSYVLQEASALRTNVHIWVIISF